jgi:malonyl-CoA O-methyltransferase
LNAEAAQNRAFADACRARPPRLISRSMTLDSQDTLAVPGLDPAAARRWARRLPSESAWLHEEVASRMMQRLQWFREKPDSWGHWEPAVGGVRAHRALSELLPDAECRIWARDMSHALHVTRTPAKRSWNPVQWRRAREPLPLDAASPVSMLWANMVLHHEPLPRQLLQAWHSALQVNGFLMFSCLGPDSLKELRGVYERSGWPAPAHAFTDMHDWGDMLVASGFAEPVMDMERINLSFSTAQALLEELRGLGRNLHADRFGALRGRRWHAALLAALEAELPRDESGRLLLTFEVVYGHAFKPPPRVRLAAEQAVSVDDMRAMLRSGRR